MVFTRFTIIMCVFHMQPLVSKKLIPRFLSPYQAEIIVPREVSILCVAVVKTLMARR